VPAHIVAAQTEIDAMAKPGKSGKNKIVANEDWKTVSTMAKSAALSSGKVEEMEKYIKTLQRDRDKWKLNYENLWEEVKDFIKAIRAIPNRLRAFIAECLLNKSNNREESR